MTPVRKAAKRKKSAKPRHLRVVFDRRDWDAARQHLAAAVKRLVLEETGQSVEITVTNGADALDPAFWDLYARTVLETREDR